MTEQFLTRINSIKLNRVLLLTAEMDGKGDGFKVVARSFPLKIIVAEYISFQKVIHILLTILMRSLAQKSIDTLVLEVVLIWKVTSICKG
jgi:hypothetical protein